MCGICYVRRLDSKLASKMIEKRYRKQKERGSEGFGYVAICDNIVKVYRRSATEKSIIEKLNEETATEILFHHRFPTSTPNFAEASHPIKVDNEKLSHIYYVVHNGIISNDDELKPQHEAEGYKYTTELVQKWRNGGNTIQKQIMWNDSEALAIELAKDLDGEALGIPQMTGSIAFIALQVDKKSKEVTKVFFGRNSGNPLKLETVKGQFIGITSQGSGINIKENTLYTIDNRTNEVEEKAYTIGVTYRYAGYNYTDDYDDNGYNLLPAKAKGTYKDDDKYYADEADYDKIYLENEIWELEAEYDDMLDSLTREDDENEKWYIGERLKELSEDIKKLKHNYEQKTLE